MQKQVWGESPRIPENFKKWGGGVPYNNLWSVAVLGHSASWSLVVAKGQGGSSWELVTPCVRSAVVDILVNPFKPKNLMGNIQSSRLLYECPAETRLTVFRRFSILTLGEITWTLDRRHLEHLRSDFEFNRYSAFPLLVLLH